MKLSNIIGTLSGVEAKINVDGETFYETNLVLDGKSFPARVPEYLQGISGKCKVCCTIESTKKDNKMFTFVNIMTAERLKDQKTPDSNTFSIIAKIQKKGQVIPIPHKGTVSYSMVASVITGVEDVKVSTIHITSTDKIARQLACKEVKEMVDLEGYIKIINNCLYFQATKVGK